MKILIPVEGQMFLPEIEKTLQTVAGVESASIRVLHAIEPVEDILKCPVKLYRQEAEELVAEVKTILQEKYPGAIVDTLLVDNHAKDGILAEAEGWPADLIVMGSHGRKGLGKFLLGSVTSAVVPLAVCPVLIVKHLQEQEAKEETAKKKMTVLY
jgi:nucleotide-binding universal stress UspA family protein